MATIAKSKTENNTLKILKPIFALGFELNKVFHLLSTKVYHIHNLLVSSVISVPEAI